MEAKTNSFKKQMHREVKKCDNENEEGFVTSEA